MMSFLLSANHPKNSLNEFENIITSERVGNLMETTKIFQRVFSIIATNISNEIFGKCIELYQNENPFPRD